MTSTVSNISTNVISSPQEGQNYDQRNQRGAPDKPQAETNDQPAHQDDDRLEQSAAEQHIGSSLTAFLAMIAEKRASAAGDLINYFNRLEPADFTVTLKSSRPAVAANNAATLNNCNLVARSVISVQSQINAPIALHPSRDIEVDISFAADSHTYVPQDGAGAVPLFESANHVQKLIGFISQYKVRTYANYADPQAYRPTQAPHLLAYLHGLLLGYSDRRRIAPVNNKPNIMRELFMIGQNVATHMTHDNMAGALFTTGPLAAPPVAASHVGPFPYTQIAQGTNVSFDFGAHILLPQRMVSQDAIHHYMWLIWAMRERMPPAFRNTFRMNLNFYGTAPANDVQFPDANTALTVAQFQAALSAGYHLLHYMFNGDDDLIDFYVQRGCDALFRVHSFYTEGGLIRKTIRTAPLTSLTGIYYIDHIPSSPGPHIFNSPHPGITAALMTFSECLTLQAVYSYTGPKLVIFDPAYHGPVHNVPLNDDIPAENVWTINAANQTYAVSQAYFEIITRPEESQILQTVYAQMFGNTASVRLRALHYSLMQSHTTVKNLRKSKNQVRRRPPGVAPLKFDTAIINRFHDPEVAYRLGLLSDGIRPLHGMFNIDLVKELTNLFNGGDLRNCPGLLTIQQEALNNLVHLDCDPRLRATGYTTLDGQRHHVDPRSRAVTVYQWHNHGLTARPYACHILESQNMHFAPNAPSAYPLVLANNVTGLGIPERMYQGPSLQAAGRQSGGPMN